MLRIIVVADVIGLGQQVDEDHLLFSRAIVKRTPHDLKTLAFRNQFVYLKEDVPSNRTE